MTWRLHAPRHTEPPWRAAIEACFYGHVFYGICAAAQIVETSVQLALPLNGWLIVTSFVATILFYSYPYSGASATSADPRVVWHARHRTLVHQLQRWGLAALLALAAWLVVRHHRALRTITMLEGLTLFAFPCAGALYYGVPATSPATTLRQIGWLKPFVIGFVWSGIVVAYPILFARLMDGHRTALELFPCLLFVKTLMFVAVLAILFDIKDHEDDWRRGLSTVATRIGPDRTLFQVSVPLTILGIVTYLAYAVTHQLTPGRIILVLTPFGLLLAAIVSLRRPRPVLYYLTVIDGLMLAKALFDIVAFRI